MIVKFDKVFNKTKGFVTSKPGAIIRFGKLSITDQPDHKLSEIKKNFSLSIAMDKCLFEIEETPNFIAIKRVFDKPIKERKDQIKFFIKEFHKGLDETFSIYEAKYLGLFLIANYPSSTTFSVKLSDPYDYTKINHTISFDEKRLKELYPIFETEIRRSYSHDLYLHLAKFSIVIRRILDNKTTLNIALTDEIIDKAPTQLYSLLDKEEKKFLDFFHSVRNSDTHYDGNHNLINKLDYTFMGHHFHTNSENVGTQIIWSGVQLMQLKLKLQEIFTEEKILKHPFVLKKLS